MIIGRLSNSSQTPRRFITNEISQYCYIPILKNAHSFGIRIFADFADFTEVPRLKTDKKYIVFLRNPINRWYSAVAQYVSMNFNDDGQILSYDEVKNTDINNQTRKKIVLDTFILKLFFDAVRLDTHSDLQLKELYGINTHNCVFFNLDDSEFNFNLLHFMKTKMKCRVPNEFTNQHQINFSKFSSFKTDIIRQLQDYTILHPKALSSVNFYYREDFELIKDINFYNLRKV